MATIKPIFNQTNYDIAMQLYGNLDILIGFAISNGVTDLSVIVNQYTYDINSKLKNSNFTGYLYSTDYSKLTNICSIPSGLSTVFFTASEICFRFNNSVGSNYQYFYNTTGTTPSEGDWLNTSASIVIITGLTENVNYYIFVRTKCNDVLFSNPINIQQVTTPGGYFQTEDGGLIFESEDGVVFKNEA